MGICVDFPSTALPPFFCPPPPSPHPTCPAPFLPASGTRRGPHAHARTRAHRLQDFRMDIEDYEKDLNQNLDILRGCLKRLNHKKITDSERQEVRTPPHSPNTPRILHKRTHARKHTTYSYPQPTLTRTQGFRKNRQRWANVSSGQRQHAEQKRYTFRDGGPFEGPPHSSNRS